MSVSIIIPTFQRPGGLRAALTSVMAQSRQPDELIVVDNSADGSARQTTRNIEAVARFPVTYVHEPKPGVSNARNAGLAVASKRYVAFLDDDEIASPGWLEALLNTARQFNAPVVFGPLRGETENLDDLRYRLARRLYSRCGPSEDGTLSEPFGCGNSLFDREAFDLPSIAFDPALNETGGEDDAFFADLETQGAQFAWSAKALAIETVDNTRTKWTHVLARSFAFGQGATQNCARGERPNWPAVAFWMSVGLTQLLIFTPLAGLAALVRAPQTATLLDKAVQAAGKLLWFERFEPRFYGQSAVTD
jgi:succinoglycan biosynthesis protein ExoM